MAITYFITSLIDPATQKPDLIISADCKSIAVTDRSTFGSPVTETGFQSAAKFSVYRKIIVEHQSGKTWTMSAQAGGDQLIQPASSTVNTFTYTIGFGDGVYKFRLIEVPVWNGGDNYINQSSTILGPQVVYNAADGLLYKNLVAQSGTNQNQQPDLSPLYWAVIPETDLYNMRFSTFEKIAVFCAANVCYFNTVAEANCAIGQDPCAQTLCGNKNLLNAAKINSLVDGIIWAAQKGKFDLAEKYFDSLATICNC